MNNVPTFDSAVSRFGSLLKAKLSNISVDGAPEDQLRAPFEALVQDLARNLSFKAGSIVTVGETSLSELSSRPDYAVTSANLLVGFVELKAPGKGADPRRFSDKHDLAQWEKLKLLPNLLYADGNAFSLWRDGELIDDVVELYGNVATSGPRLKAPASLLRLFHNFLTWEPSAPKGASALADLSARLCRLLRDEVLEELRNGVSSIVGLSTDWRQYLFPDSEEQDFADGYAQAITFGLLLAKANGIMLCDGLSKTSELLSKNHSIIGAAFRILTDQANGQQALETSLAVMVRVLDKVDWNNIGDKGTDTWLYFYEDFLSAYDKNLKQKTGSYYTPPEVVKSMVRFTDLILRDKCRFNITDGLASSQVFIADPAMGTGTYLLGVLRRIAEVTERQQGAGAVADVIKHSLNRLIGFEIQFGPFAVAQLRILAEIVELVGTDTKTSVLAKALRMYVTDTLGNPDVENEHIPQFALPLAESRRQANKIKREQPITVVIGNPPYKHQAKNKGGWIELGSGQSNAPLDSWLPPASWGLGAHVKHLHNQYIYFWRWATWKVFGDTSSPLSRPDKKSGLVSFISASGFLAGPGFAKMRDDLRRSADEIWVINCSPEGQQPPVTTRIFPTVQQPICIVTVMRKHTKATSVPAKTRFIDLPTGSRQIKFDALASLTLDDGRWSLCPDDWRSPFLPASSDVWAQYYPLEKIVTKSTCGVMTGRTWVIAPDQESLVHRWNTLRKTKELSIKKQLFQPHLKKGGKPGDKHLEKPLSKGLSGHEFRSKPVESDEGDIIQPIKYAYRSFDLQYIIPDGRLINRCAPTLWENYSSKQLYMTGLLDKSPTSGPAITFACHIPDMDHYKGGGGRVFSLWSDKEAKASNVNGDVKRKMKEAYREPVSDTDIFYYIAAVMAHPYYTKKFKASLKQPGLRVPITTTFSLYLEAIDLGRQVVSLHTLEEFQDRQSTSNLQTQTSARAVFKPKVTKEGAIATNNKGLPATMRYDANDQRLFLGSSHPKTLSPYFYIDFWASGIALPQQHW